MSASLTPSLSSPSVGCLLTIHQLLRLIRLNSVFLGLRLLRGLPLFSQNKPNPRLNKSI